MNQRVYSYGVYIAYVHIYYPAVVYIYEESMYTYSVRLLNALIRLSPGVHEKKNRQPTFFFFVADRGMLKPSINIIILKIE